jgi:hypothetical protein
MTSLRQKMIEDMQIRNLAVNTQKSYIQQVSLFARYFQKSPELLGHDQSSQMQAPGADVLAIPRSLLYSRYQRNPLRCSSAAFFNRVRLRPRSW